MIISTCKTRCNVNLMMASIECRSTTVLYRFSDCSFVSFDNSTNFELSMRRQHCTSNSAHGNKSRDDGNLMSKQLQHTTFIQQACDINTVTQNKTAKFRWGQIWSLITDSLNAHLITHHHLHSTIHNWGPSLSSCHCLCLYLEQFTPARHFCTFVACLPVMPQDSSLHHFLSQSLTLYSSCAVTPVILDTLIVHGTYSLLTQSIMLLAVAITVICFVRCTFMA